MEIGYALTEELRCEGGKMLTLNFDDYRLPRFSSLPRIEVVFLDNPRTVALGGGEPPIICMAPPSRMRLRRYRGPVLPLAYGARARKDRSGVEHSGPLPAPRVDSSEGCR
jgi:hypothetical protein